MGLFSTQKDLISLVCISVGSFCTFDSLTNSCWTFYDILHYQVMVETWTWYVQFIQPLYVSSIIVQSQPMWYALHNVYEINVSSHVDGSRMDSNQSVKEHLLIDYICLWMVIIRIVQDCILSKTIVEKNSSIWKKEKKKLKQKSCFKSRKFLLFKIDMHLVGRFEFVFV